MSTFKTCTAGIATILSCKQIAQSFSENIYELSTIRKNWSPKYAETLKKQIENILETYFSYDSLAELLEKHSQMHDLMIAAVKDVTVFRAQLKVDFKNDKKFIQEVFDQLGYTDFYSETKNGDHWSLYRLMSSFSKNMDAELMNRILSAGIDKHLIDRLVSYREKLTELKSCLEVLQNSTSKIEAEAHQKINEVYTEIKDICRIATAYYEFDPVQRDKFCFYHVMINLKKSMLHHV
jgi:hypothetical protein